MHKFECCKECTHTYYRTSYRCLKCENGSMMKTPFERVEEMLNYVKYDLDVTNQIANNINKEKETMNKMIMNLADITYKNGILSVDQCRYPVVIKSITVDHSPTQSRDTASVDCEILLDHLYPHIIPSTRDYHMMYCHNTPATARRANNLPKIKDVIFNNPATIVFWEDGTKTVVKCGKDDNYDAEKGLAMAMVKKMLGNEGKYYNEIKKWVE